MVMRRYINKNEINIRNAEMKISTTMNNNRQNKHKQKNGDK